MKNRERLMKKLREMEIELIYAPPPRAAKLASEIVKLKATIFD